MSKKLSMSDFSGFYCEVSRPPCETFRVVLIFSSEPSNCLMFRDPYHDFECDSIKHFTSSSELPGDVANWRFYEETDGQWNWYK